MRYCIIHRIHDYEKKRRLVIQEFLQVDESLPCEALEKQFFDCLSSMPKEKYDETVAKLAEEGASIAVEVDYLKRLLNAVEKVRRDESAFSIEDLFLEVRTESDAIHIGVTSESYMRRIQKEKEYINSQYKAVTLEQCLALPFRAVLDDAKIQFLQAYINSVWPEELVYRIGKLNEALYCMDNCCVEKESFWRIVIQRLKSLGIDHMYELNYCRPELPSFELDVTLMTYLYKTETFWLSEQHQIGIFKCHEGFYFFYGKEWGETLSFKMHS